MQQLKEISKEKDHQIEKLTRENATLREKLKNIRYLAGITSDGVITSHNQ